MSKNISVIDKSDIMPCWTCNTTGKVDGKKM